MLELDISGIGFDQLERDILRAEQRLERNRRRFLKDAADLTEQTLVQLSPLGWTGNFRASMTQEITDDAAFVYSSDVPGKTLSLEFGRKSRKLPPIGALAPWVAFKWGGDLGDAVRVAHAIADGTSTGTANTGQQPFQRTFDQVAPRIVEMADLIVEVF